jgi:hypothetical protein
VRRLTERHATVSRKVTAPFAIDQLARRLDLRTGRDTNQVRPVTYRPAVIGLAASISASYTRNPPPKMAAVIRGSIAVSGTPPTGPVAG